MAQTGRALVLLVDDNPRVRSFVRPALEDAGFDCIEAGDGWTALEMVRTDSPDLVVLDIHLGDEQMNGLDVCKKIREMEIRVPVIFLTIEDRTENPQFMARAFELGADAYIGKREELKHLEQHMGLRPSEFIERKSDIAELVANIKARLAQAETVMEMDDYLKVDLVKQQVHVNRLGAWREEQLTPKEFSILAMLIRSKGRPIGKHQLMDAADVDGESSLQNHIYKLRQKLEPDPKGPRYILTYHKIGYRFRSPE